MRGHVLRDWTSSGLFRFRHLVSGFSGKKLLFLYLSVLVHLLLILFHVEHQSVKAAEQYFPVILSFVYFKESVDEIFVGQFF